MSGENSILTEAIVGQMPLISGGSVGVAVSGGGDSLALMLILADWARENNISLFAATVDHGLRPEAAQEAHTVAEIAQKNGIPHETLSWQGWDGAGNLQDRARRARYQLLLDWAEKHQIGVVALGHTADDQAETVLMRLAREAGVDGLSGMGTRRKVGSVEFVRPMLQRSRAELREYLTSRGQVWVDDPTNHDDRYDRIKARNALELLRPLGITAEGLVQVAAAQDEARKALNWFSFINARGALTFQAGEIIVDRRSFRTWPDEIARRVMVRALCWVSGLEYGPRRRPMRMLLDSVRSGSGMTLHGCQIDVRSGEFSIIRELKALEGVKTPTDKIWDRRWRVIGPFAPELHVAALGREGLKSCVGWQETGLSAQVLAVSPAIWSQDQLIAAPVAGFSNGWRVKLAEDGEDFFASLISH